MNFIVADTFFKSLARLDGQSQALAKQAYVDFQMQPATPGGSFHRIDRTRDKHFWSYRVTRDLWMIIHHRGDNAVFCYVDHHDAAYQWAENRRLRPHPTTGAVQIVEVVEDVVVEKVFRRVETEPPLFSCYELDYLLALGVLEEWLDAARHVGESHLLAFLDRLPEEARERLFDLSQGLPVPRPASLPSRDAFAHPDSQRRFRVVDNQAELLRALSEPLERWAVFLHPDQRSLAQRAWAGPARVTGGAGTGKTVVALHRAAHLARSRPDARILLTTFSRTLAVRMRHGLDVLLGADSAERRRIRVDHLHRVARELWTESGHAFNPAPPDRVDAILRELAARSTAPFDPAFLQPSGSPSSTPRASKPGTSTERSLAPAAAFPSTAASAKPRGRRSRPCTSGCGRRGSRPGTACATASPPGSPNPAGHRRTTTSSSTRRRTSGPPSSRCCADSPPRARTTCSWSGTRASGSTGRARPGSPPGSTCAAAPAGCASTTA